MACCAICGDENGHCAHNRRGMLGVWGWLLNRLCKNKYEGQQDEGKERESSSDQDKEEDKTHGTSSSRLSQGQVTHI